MSQQISALSSLRLSKADQQDTEAQVLSLLVLGSPGGEPKLLRFGGFGALGGWLRVLITREALARKQRQDRERPVEDELLLGKLESPEEDPELQVLKARYGPVVASAFRKAVETLSPRDRNLLRQHYLDGLSLEETARLYRVHRATAARWLSAARESLLETTRSEVASACGLPRLQVDSIMRLVQSRLDLSAGFFLR